MIFVGEKYIKKIISSEPKGIRICEDHDRVSGRYIYLYNAELYRYVHVSYLSIKSIKNGNEICYYLLVDQELS